MTQPQDLDFVPGPALEPAAQLLDWLENTIKPARTVVRLPVVVSFEDEHRLGWGPIRLGTADDALHLELDDGALGIPLLDTLASDCPKDAPTCALWLEGTWGALMDMPDFGFEEPGPKKHPFAVLKVVGPVDGEAKTALVTAP